MSYKKLKQEQYSNIGGINTKASVYVTGEREVLDLVNYDFQTPGAWVPRFGMTSALTGNTLALGASNRINFSFQVLDTPYYSTSRGASNVRYVNYGVGCSGIVTLDNNGGNIYSPEVGASHPLIVTTGRGNAVNFAAGGRVVAVFSAGGISYKSSYETGFQYYGLPEYPMNLTIGSTGTGSLSGTYFFKVAYNDSYDYVGKAMGATNGISVAGVFAIYVSGLTFTTKAIQSNANKIILYMYPPNGPAGVFSEKDTVTLPLSSATFTVTSNSVSSADPEYIDSLSNNTFTGNTNGPTSLADCVEYYAQRIWIGSGEIQNILYFSEKIETTADAETILPENFIQLPNQDQPFVGMKAYNQTLMVFNQKGVTRITGDNLDNFSGVELTRDYGLVSSRAIVEWNEKLWFLDEGQIVEYNGAGFNVVSDRVESILARMNVSAAKQTAGAYYYSERNEVWFSIPVDGSNECNIVLVYNTLANGWTTFKSSFNFNMLEALTIPVLVPTGLSSLTLGYVNDTFTQTNRRLFVSSPGGSLTYFGSSYLTDSGSRFTLSFRTRFHAEQGHSVTNLWRMFFLDNGPWAGVTLPFNVNFYSNFSTNTISATRTMFFSGSSYYGKQQAAVQMGIAAKSLSAEVIYGTTVMPSPIYGYTIERRYLRDV